MQKQEYTESSRKYAAQNYVIPARDRGDKTVRINAGEVHKALGFRQRVPAVCQALQSKKFLEENRLILEKIEGPPSGQSTRVTFTYQLHDGSPLPSKKPEEDTFPKLRGIAKGIFRELGGGENFIRKERERFYGSDVDQ
jgi:hypothetical protein